MDILSAPNNGAFVSFLSDFGLNNLLPAAVILLIGLLVMKLLTNAEGKLFARPNSLINPAQGSFIQSCTKALLWIVIVLEVCKALGISTTSLLTMFAACGAAIALALQGSLSNLASGILMTFTRPFGKGDYIVCGGTEGFVESTGLLATKIVTLDNRVLSIPNSTLTAGILENQTDRDIRRIEITIGVAYSSDLDFARQTVIDCAMSTGYFLEDPEPICNVAEYGDAAIKLSFLGWVKTPDVIPATGAMNNALKPALDKAGIEIPCPTFAILQK